MQTKRLVAVVRKYVPDYWWFLEAKHGHVSILPEDYITVNIGKEYPLAGQLPTHHDAQTPLRLVIGKTK